MICIIVLLHISSSRHTQLLESLASMTVAASNWTEVEDHMMLIYCIRDSIDMEALGLLVDTLDTSRLSLTICTDFLSTPKITIIHFVLSVCSLYGTFGQSEC